MNDSNKAITNFLSQAQNFPDQTEKVETIETHISQVFLGRSLVYKIKKPVQFEFVDFSTLEKRLEACQNEVNLNRRLAQGVYLRIQAIYLTDRGELSWEKSSSSAHAIEWVVVMKRLPQDQMLDQRLRTDRPLAAQEVHSLCQHLKQFYSDHRLDHLDFKVWFHELKHHTQANIHELQDLVPSLDRIIQVIASRQMEFLLLEEERFRHRVDCAMIVDGHGDLKPEHICMTSPPVIYDCIEFDRNYRVNDTLDELSFLALECEVLGHKNFGEQILQSALPKDTWDAQFCSFYRSYRACMRAKVESIKFKIQSPTVANIPFITDQYLKLALTYAKQLGPVRLIAIGGLMGSGKTTLARLLADQTHGIHLESDRVRKKIFPDSSSLQTGFAESRYQPEAKEKVYQAMISETQNLLKDGITVIFDASFIASSHRTALRKIAESDAIPFHFFWMSCDDETAISRIQHRRLYEQTDSEAREDLYQQQKQNFQNFETLETPIILNSEDSLAKNLTRMVLSIRS